jgi:hypothetical protein
MRRFPVALSVAVVAAFLGPAVAHAARPAFLSGTLTGAPVPAKGGGFGLVRAVDLRTGMVTGAARASAQGKFRLTLAPGAYAVIGAVIDLGSRSFRTRPGVAVSLRAGQQRVVPVAVAKAPKKKLKKRGRTVARRHGARAAYFQKSGKETPGVTAFQIAVKGGPDWLSGGVESILGTDMLGAGGCPTAEVAGSRDLGLLDNELELQKSPYFDPSTRVKSDRIVPDVLVDGQLSEIPGGTAYTFDIVNARTGEVIFSKTGELGLAAGYGSQVDKLAPILSDAICHPPKKEPAPPEHISVQVSATHHRFTPGSVTVTWSGTALATRDHNTPPGTMQYSITSMNVADYTYKLVDPVSGCTIHGTYAGTTPASGFVEIAVDGNGGYSYRMRATLTDLAITVITDGGPKCDGTQEEQVEGYAKSSADGPDRLPAFRPYTTFPISDTSQWTDVNFDGSTTFVLSASAS